MSSVLDKIKRLLALAEDQAGLPEGERAAAIAERLMREHAISVAQLAEPPPDPIVEQEQHTTSATWRVELVATVARHCSCSAWRMRGSGTVVLVGHTSDVEVARYLFELCVRQIDAAARAFVQGVHPRLRRAHGTAFRRSAVAGLAHKLQAQRDRAATTDPSGTALVHRRWTSVEAFMERAHPHLRSRRGSAYSFSRAGWDAGQQVQLTGGLKGGAGAGLTGARALLTSRSG